MKRYNIMGKRRQGGAVYRIRVIEHPEGELVKYEDVKHIIDIYEACEKTTSAFREAMAEDVLQLMEKKGCNCAEKSLEISDIIGKAFEDGRCTGLCNIWICPAHGYKRL